MESWPITGANQCSTGLLPVTVTAMLLAQLGRGGVGRADVARDQLRGGRLHVAAVAQGAVAGDGEGCGVGRGLQPGALGVERADVDRDRGEAQERDEQKRDDDGGGAALARQPASRTRRRSRLSPGIA